MRSEPARTHRGFTAAVDQATVGFHVPLEDLAPAAGRVGLRVLEVPAFAVAAYRGRHGRTGLQALLDRHSVRIGQLSCGSGVPADLAVSSEQWPGAVALWRRSCHLAVAIGCPRLSVFVPRSATIEANVVAERLGALAAVAAADGLAVNVELHAPALLRRAGWIWQQAAAPGAGLLVDVAALALAGLDPLAYIPALPGGAVAWVHLADLTAPWGRSSRVLPGLGCLPLAAALDALANGGYAGPIAVEVPRRQPTTGETVAHLAQAAAALTGGSLVRFFPGGAR